MASTNSASFLIEFVRTVTNRGTRDLKQSVTIDEVAEFKLIEVVVAANDTKTVSFAEFTTAAHVVIVTPKPVNLRINGAAVDVPCGSIAALLHTAVTELTIENTTDEEITVEVWLLR